MKILSLIAGILLGLLFIASGLVVLLKLAPMPPPPEGSPASHFFLSFGPTGYLSFVKVLEVLGGLLVAIPRTRRAGLLILGPILVNILAFHVFLMGGKDLVSPPILIIVLLTCVLVWAERNAFVQFLWGGSATPAA